MGARKTPDPCSERGDSTSADRPPAEQGAPTKPLGPERNQAGPDPPADAAPAESEQRLALAAEGAELGTWDHDLLTGDVDWNDALYDLLGRERGSPVTGETFFEYVHPDDLPRVRDHVEDTLESGRDFVDEFRVVREDGEVRWLAGRGRISRDDAGRAVRMAGVNFDITERVHAQQERQRTEKRFHDLFRTMAEGFLLLEMIRDEEGNAVDCRAIEANPAIEPLTGLRRQDVLSRSLRDLFPDVDPVWIETFGRVEEIGEPVALEQYFAPLERHYHMAAYCPAPGQVAVVLTDITDRVRAQEALRRSEGRYRSVITDAPIPVMLHALDGEVLALSQAFTKITGYTRRDVPTYRKWVQKAYGVSADEARKLEAELRVEHMRTDSRRRRSEETVRTKSGETRTWLVHGSYVRRASDDRGLMVTMGLDITERREAEARIRDLARFPEENPNPVLRISTEGEMLHANPAARAVLDECGCADADKPPVDWRRLARHAREQGIIRRAEIECADRTFVMAFVPIPGTDYTNVYGLDISLRKRAEDALMQARADLEHEVEDRTRELSDANRRLRATVDELAQARDELRESTAVVESVFDNTHMLIAYMDRDFNFIRVNRAYAAADGATPDALVGKNHFDLYPDPENERIFRQVVETGQPYYVFARAFEYADNPERGTTYWDWSLQPVIDEAGEVEGLILCLIDVTERRRATQELERSRQQLRALTARSLELVEEERRRMAREVHDGLGQELTALQTGLGVLRRKVAQADGPLDPGAVIERLDRMLADAETTVGTVRDISRRLRPSALDELGLDAAIEEEAEAFESRTGIACRVHLSRQPVSVGGERSTAMFRILREALANVERHAEARAVDVSLASRGGTVALTVADDGVGITPEEEASPTSLGLLGMKERAFRLGGNVTVRGAPGEGTAVTVSLPIDREEQEP